MMKQRSNGDQSYLAGLFTEEELEISQFLLQLPQVIAKTSLLSVSPGWGTRRQRSALDSNPLFVPGSGASKRNRESESPSTATNKVVALSPATPFLFSPSESDENPESSKKKSSVEKKKEELVGVVDGLTQRREMLKGELENVKDHYDKLKAFNSELKARKQGINAELERENISSEFADLKLESAPATKDQTAHEPCSSFPSITESGAQDLNLSPLGIPDLNISLNESQPLELSRAAVAAQARQKRIQIYRAKNSIVASRPRFNSR